MASGYTTYNANGTVKSFTPAAAYKAQVASDIASGRDTAPGVGGAINQNVTGAPTAGQNPATGTITSGTLQQTPAIQLPTQTNPNYAGVLAGIQAGITPQETEKTVDTSQQDQMGLNSLMAQIGLIPQKESVLNDSAVKKQQQAVDQAKQQAANYTAQLNSITANSQAQQLQLEGQGRGQTTAFLGGEQARISREAAIQALPVAAQLAAAQGNVELAQQHLDQIYKIRSEEINNAFDYKMKVYDSVRGFLDKQEARQAAALEKADQRAYSEQTNNLNYARDLADTARQNGQVGLAARILALDPKSAGYGADVARLAGQIQPKMTGDGAPTVKSINGVDMQWNASTGTWETIPGGANQPPSYKSESASTGRQAIVGLLDIANRSPGIFGRSATVPIPDFARSPDFLDYKAKLDFLKGNVIPAALTAMREASKTGGALGQVSDREGAWLGSSLGALDMSQSPAQVINQLQQIDQHLRTWQNAVSASQAQGVEVTGGDGQQYIITD